MNIVDIASVVTAITVVCGFIIKLLDTSHKVLKEIERLEEEMKYDRIHILKLALFSSDLPIQDRIEAGRKYIEMGGNGTGKIEYEMLLERYKKEQAK